MVGGVLCYGWFCFCGCYVYFGCVNALAGALVVNKFGLGLFNCFGCELYLWF